MYHVWKKRLPRVNLISNIKMIKTEERLSVFCWHLREGYFFISPGYGVKRRDSGKSLGKSEIQTWEAASLEEILKLNSAYVIMSLASKVRPWEKLSSLEAGTNFEDHWGTFKEPDLVGDLPSIHQILLPASTQKNVKKKKWEVKRRCSKDIESKEANLLLQDFTTENGDECGSKIRTSEWEQGHQSRRKSIAARQKAQRGQLLETSNYSFSRKVKTRERKLFWWRNTITIISYEH